MIRLLITAIFLASTCIFFVASAAAEEAVAEEAVVEESPQRQFFGAEHRQEIYESSRLQRRRALLYSAALPGLGNFYAEQYALGTVAMSILVFGATFLTYGLLNNHPELVRLGIGLGIVSYGGSAVSSYIGVQQYNDRLRRSLHLDSHLTPRISQNSTPLGVGFQVRF